MQAVGITTVAMESTGVYWIPVFELLEERGFEGVLVKARDVKHVPGRKTEAGETGVWVSRDLRVGFGYATRPMTEPGQAVTIASGRGGGYIVLSTRLATLFDLGGRLAGGRAAAAGR